MYEIMMETYHLSTDVRMMIVNEKDGKGWKCVIRKQVRRPWGDWETVQKLHIRRPNEWERLITRVDLLFDERGGIHGTQLGWLHWLFDLSAEFGNLGDSVAIEGFIAWAHRKYKVPFSSTAWRTLLDLKEETDDT